jgi:hypothetical protein
MWECQWRQGVKEDRKEKRKRRKDKRKDKLSLPFECMTETTHIGCRHYKIPNNAKAKSTTE